MKNDFTKDRDPCASCGSFDLEGSLQTQRFVYGAGSEAVELETLVPVWTCSSCGVQYTDESGEDRRHEAVCHYLGRLTPSDIVQIRQNYRMTQDELAALTGLGVASIKRWEGGNQIQSESSDKFLRLVALPSNVAYLSVLTISDVLKVPSFKTPISAVSINESSRFKLRRRSISGGE